MALEPILDAGVRWSCAGVDKVDNWYPCTNNGVVFVWVYVGHAKHPSQFTFCETHLREIAVPLLESADD